MSILSDVIPLGTAFAFTKKRIENCVCRTIETETPEDE
jgi:hypothetical protein